MPTKTFFGKTLPTAWQQYKEFLDGKSAIYVDIDTSFAKFIDTPIYLTSLGGRTGHWLVTGYTAIYNATPNGFRVYVTPVLVAAGMGVSELTPAKANQQGWYIQWTATGTVA